MADELGYHTIEAGAVTLSSDSIFTQYQKGLKQLVNLIQNCPEELGTELLKIFPVDPYCQCQLGMQPRSLVSCIHCTQIRRLMDYRYIAPDTEFVVVAGRYTGKKILAQECEKVSYSVTVQNSCANKLVIMDKFTLSNVIHCYIYQSLLSIGFHTILPCYTAFTCATNGYKLIRASDPLSDVMIDDLACQQVLKQMATTLDYLTHINFHRRNPKASDWRVICQPVAYSYKGVSVNAPFRVVLSDFSDSTMRVGEHWFVDYQSQAVMVNRPLQNVGPVTFRLTPSTIDEFHYQRGTGQWNNGSYLWCSYLTELWPLLSHCSRLSELSGLFPVETTSCYYQDLPQNALAASLEHMAKW